MKFMMMMHTPYGKDGDYQVNEWTPDSFKAHIAFMKSFNSALREAGEFVSAEGLTTPRQARVVRAGKDGSPEVTDGPFAESKEFLAGYWIIDVESRERAYAVAAKASTAPGPDGKPLNLAIELREIMSGPPPGG